MTAKTQRNPHARTTWAVAAVLCTLASAAHALPAAGLRARAEQAFAALHRESPRADATWDADKPGAALVTGLSTPTIAGTPRQRAEAFLQAHADLLAVAATELRYVDQKQTRNRTVARFTQLCPIGLGGLPVYNRFVTVAMDNDGRVLTISSDVLPVAPFQRGTLTEAQARDAAVRAVFGTRPEDKTPVAQVSQAHATVLATAGKSVHAFVVEVVRTPLQDVRLVLVDARDGHLLEQHNTVLH